MFNGIHLVKDVPQFRLLSRRVVNFVLRHSAPALAYRHLPATAGFANKSLRYRAEPRGGKRKPLVVSIERGVRSLIATSRAPMRVASTLSLFGAFANIIYSVYVLIVAAVKHDIARGWVTLSLQQSGMFLLMSLVLFMLGEYMVYMTQLSIGGPGYHVSREHTSTLVTRRQRLNIEHEDVPQRPSHVARTGQTVEATGTVESQKFAQ
jgi:hypothetical protein